MNQILSKTKDEILEGKIEGKSERRIARELNVTRQTVRRYSEPDFVLTHDPEVRRQLRDLVAQHLPALFQTHEKITEIENRLRDIVSNLSDNDLAYDQQTLQTYQKFLNTQINLRDKVLRTIALFLPSKQISIEDYTNRKLIQVKAEVD